MTEEEISHLGRLARLRLSGEEIKQFTKEIDAILAYVGTINEITESLDRPVTVGARHNVFREDRVTNEPGAYTEKITRAFPRASNGYLEVPKIIPQD